MLKVKNFFWLLSVAILIVSLGTIVKAEESLDSRTGWYYPIMPETEEWASYDDKSSILELLQIPEDILLQMSTKELVDVVLDYPYLSDAFYYNDLQVGMQKVCKNFNGIRELLNRIDATQCLITKYRDSDIATIDGEQGFTLYDEIPLLLARPEILNATTAEEYRDITFILSNDVTSVFYREKAGDVISYVKTPNNSSVEVMQRVELNMNDIQKFDYETKRNYPEATFLISSTNKYNCHSYAWYSQNTSSNLYWMNDASKYMADKSYYEVAWPSMGDKVYWKGVSHSAVVYSGASEPESMTVTSKWGSGPLMRHKTNKSPYAPSTTGYSYWRR